MHKLFFLGLLYLLLFPNTNISTKQTQSKIDLSLKQLYWNENPTNTFEIKYYNKSEEPVKLIKMMDGSTYAWIYPRHQFKVNDNKEKKLELLGRCGLYGQPFSGTSFPEDYLVEIPPKSYHFDTLFIIQSVPLNGNYELSFEYEFNYSKVPFVGNLSEDIWVGKAVTPTKTYFLIKN